MSVRALNIMGIRGIPAAHGGFETFAMHFAPYMENAGWKVIVYCQGLEGQKKPRAYTDEWQGIKRIHFDTRSRGALATIEFDLKCTLDVLGRPGIDLVLGYNTALFSILQRISGRKVLMNMDGIEWKRAKWGKAAKIWFWLNEWIGANFCSIPIADHPQIAEHLAKRGCDRAIVIPYGSNRIDSAPDALLREYDLISKGYFISIARIEPENSILEMVKAFVATEIDRKLVVLGKLEPEKNAYHREVKASANGKVIFPGSIYEPATVSALRFHSLAYLHGHQVGGTNPSLVEALGAGNPVIAHANRFNRWVAGEGQLYFHNISECSEHMRKLSTDRECQLRLSDLSYRRHAEMFQFTLIHEQYKNCLDAAS